MSAPIRHAPARHEFTNSAIAAAFGLVTGWLLAGAEKRRPGIESDLVGWGEPDDPAWHAALNRDRAPISIS